MVHRAVMWMWVQRVWFEFLSILERDKGSEDHTVCNSTENFRGRLSCREELRIFSYPAGFILSLVVLEDRIHCQKERKKLFAFIV